VTAKPWQYGPVDVVAVRGPRGAVVYWIKTLVPQLLWPGHSDSDDAELAARVVARNAEGEEFILLRQGTYRQAARARDRFARELAEVGAAEFSRRYGLPQGWSEPAGPEAV
jgi:hypothetical protein